LLATELALPPSRCQLPVPFSVNLRADVLLSVITLVVAIAGMVLKDPSRNIKIFLIALAVTTTIGTVIKAFGVNQRRLSSNEP
jgi:hypothetical protein